MSPRKGSAPPAPKIDRPVPREWRKFRPSDADSWGNQSTDAAYRRGYHAGYRVSVDVNPYEPFSGPNRAWQAGWDIGNTRRIGEVFNDDE